MQHTVEKATVRSFGPLDSASLLQQGMGALTRFQARTFGTIVSLTLLICGLMLLPQHARAQEFRATISGAITDATGAVLPGAKVEVKETSTGTISRTVSDNAGQYVVPFLLPGDYTITVTAKGFQTLKRAGIALQAQEHPILNLALQVGSTSQTVTVTSAAPLLDLANASVGSVIPTAAVADLPLNGRTPVTLLELAPGVVSTAPPQQIHPFDNNAGNSWSIGGTPNQVSESLLDGSPNETLLGATAFNPSEDTVKEVSVQPFATDASFGHTIGGVVNQVTKSGTNMIHGTAYEFGQISGIDSNLYFNGASFNKGTQKPLPVFHFNQYGLTAGGPVMIPKVYDGRNKLFFFFAWEGLKDSSPAATALTVPTAAETSGDFSQLLAAGCPAGFASNTAAQGAMCNPYGSHTSVYNDPEQLFNPYSPTGYVGGKVVRTPIYNNQLTSVMPTLDPVGVALAKLYPSANATGTSTGQDNYNSNAPSVDNFNSEFGRMDANLFSNDHLFVDVRHNLRGQLKEQYFGTNNDAEGVTLTRENWGIVADNVYTINTSMVLDTRLNWMKFGEAHGSPAQALSPASVGLPSALGTESTMVQLPYINFNATGSCSKSSFMCLGNNGAAIDPSTSYQVFTDLIKIAGRQTIKVGFDGRLYGMSITNYGYSSGSFKYDTSWTNAGTGGTTNELGYDLAAMLLGVPSSGEYDLEARGDYHQYYVGVFAQDDIRVNDKLTVNLGLRFDINTPFEERAGRTVNGFDPTATVNYSANPVWASTTETAPDGTAYTIPSINTFGGLTFPNGSNGAVFATNNGFFSPRAGFSYALDNNTVLRGGAGIFVMPETLSNLNSAGVTSSNALSNQEGFSASTSYVTSTLGYAPGGAGSNTQDNPFPTLTQPVGNAYGASTFLGSPSEIQFLAPNESDPYSERWNIGVQRTLSNNLLVEALYEGNHGVHLPVGAHNITAVQMQYLSTAPYFNYDLNTEYGIKVNNPFYQTLNVNGVANTTGLNTSPTTNFGSFVVPFPQYNTTTINEENMTIGQSWFHGVVFHVEKRASHGLTLTGNYSFTKLIEKDSFRNDQDSFLEKRISPYDYTHHVTVGGVYELPVGKGKMFSLGGNRWLDEFLGGYVINGIYQFQSGPPIEFTSDIPLAPTVTSLRQISNNHRQITGQALSVSDFVTSSNPKSCTGVCNGTVNIGGQYVDHYRTLPTTMSWVRSDGYNNLDASILKNFDLPRGTYFQLRFETFNTLNHPVFAAPNVSSATASNFGEITATEKNSLPRQIQIGGRLVF